MEVASTFSCCDVGADLEVWPRSAVPAASAERLEGALSLPTEKKVFRGVV